MVKLTKAEEEIMQYIWRLERCTVSQILDEIEAENSDKKASSSQFGFQFCAFTGGQRLCRA
jgi:predicted transcriptional regulator